MVVGCSNTDLEKESAKVDSIQRAKLMDTVNMNTCPIEIVHSELIPGALKQIKLNYRNVSARRIIRISFTWYGLNAKNKPADNGIGNTGISGGITESALDPGAYGFEAWQAGGQTMGRLVAVWPSEVIYSDGSRWHAGRY